MAEFRRVAHAKGWRVAIAGASNEALADYADLGFKSIYLGDEAVIRPSEFSLDGRPIRKVRQSVSRLQKGGYTVRVLSTADADAGAARGAPFGLAGVARQLARARLHDGDGRAVPLPGHRARGRDRARRRGRRLPAARPVTGERGLLARLDAPPPRHAERADGVPDHRDGRVGQEPRRDRDLAQLRRLRRLHARRRGRRALDARVALGAAQGRPALPARAPAQLQPQVLPALAPPLLLLRALGRPAARRSRVPPRRVAADAARARGSRRRISPPSETARSGSRSSCSPSCRRGRAFAPHRRDRRHGLEPLRLRRRAARRRARQRHHRRERRQARPPSGQAGRHRRLVADLPPRRAGARHDARRLLRHDDLRQDRGDRREQRQRCSGGSRRPRTAARRHGADHELDARRVDRPHRRSTPRRPTAGCASCGSPTARCSGRRRSRATRRTRS